MPLLFLFIAVPLIEIALFVQLGSVLNLGWILLIVVMTAILGTWLVRQQGRGVLRQIQGSFETLRDPTEPLAHGAMILFSGALLLTPGFFTDGVGFLLLVPAVRELAFRWLRAKVVVHRSGAARGNPNRPHPQGPHHPGPRPPHGPAGSGMARQRGRPDVIEAEYEDLTAADRAGREPGARDDDDDGGDSRSDGRRPSGWTRE